MAGQDRQRQIQFDLLEQQFLNQRMGAFADEQESQRAQAALRAREQADREGFMRGQYPDLTSGIPQGGITSGIAGDITARAGQINAQERNAATVARQEETDRIAAEERSRLATERERTGTETAIKLEIDGLIGDQQGEVGPGMVGSIESLILQKWPDADEGKIRAWIYEAIQRKQMGSARLNYEQNRGMGSGLTPLTAGAMEGLGVSATAGVPGPGDVRPQQQDPSAILRRIMQEQGIDPMSTNPQDQIRVNQIADSLRTALGLGR
jgi:hypothetical protein